MTLFWLGAAWLVGLALGREAAWPVWLWLALGGAALAATLIARRIAALRLCFATLMLLCLGAARLRLAQPVFDPQHIAMRNDTPYALTITGIVVAPPDVRDQYTALRLSVETVRSGAEDEEPAHGLVLIYAPRFLDWSYGDRVSASGTLQTPPSLDDFSYREYLARQGIHSLMPDAYVRRLAARQANPLLYALYAFRSSAHHTLHKVLPDPEASLLSGILLGIESGIQPDVRKAFNDTGTSHIIAISGFNITIIAALFSKLFGRFLGRRWGATACALGIALYTILAGADASVVRAALMAGIALLGQRIGRQAFSLASLAASAMLMTALQPMALWDVGFQLSFAATLGLVLYGPPLEAWLERLASRWIRPRRARRLSRTISEFTLFTLAAQVTTLPLIAYYFRRLSLVSLLANPVILPLQPAVMVLGGLAVLGGMLFLPLGRLLGWVAWPFVALTIRAVEFFAQWPLRVIPLGRVGLLGVAAFYLLLAGFTLWAHLPAERRPSWSKLRIPATAALAALLIVTGLTWKAIMQRPDGRLHIYLLDVGSGDAVLIQSPSGRFVLIDGGPSPVALSEALGRRLPLLQRRIDWLVVGASADDYVSGLAGIAERFPIGSVLLSGDPGRSPYRRLMQELYSARIPIQHASEGHALDLGEGASLQVEALGSRGAVLLLRHGNFSMLLAPGADPEMMQGLSHQSDLGPCTVLLLADSGFAAVNPTAWLQGTRPLLALISVEGGNKEGLPSPQVLQSLQDTNLLRTDLHGWIALHSDGQQLWVEVERLPPSAPLGATLPTP